MDLPALWRSILADVAADVPSPQLRAYLGLVRPLTLVGDTVLLAAPDTHARDMIEARLRPVIAAALSRELGQPVEIAVTVRPSEDAALLEAPPDPAPHKDEHHLSVSPRRSNTGNRLNPRYVFEDFVIGPSNRFAHAAAIAVAESPARAYNPVFLHGGSGLGKTHLLHAIGHHATALGRARAVRYTSAEEFTNDYVSALRDDRIPAFQRRYRDVDILLIDDIQFLEGRERTQEEFFHTFNALHTADRQIVISSDRPPRRLDILEPRMRTRFEWGLIADIEPPDLATRVAILRRHAARERTEAPDDVLEFVAARMPDSIRELEGAFTRVVAFAGLTRVPLSLPLAERVLRDHVPAEKPAVTVERITEVVAGHFGVDPDELRGPGRSRAVAHARQVAMYLCRELTSMPLTRIGEAFGRDHTTVMHAVQRVRARMGEHRRDYDQIAELTARITRA